MSIELTSRSTLFIKATTVLSSTQSRSHVTIVNTQNVHSLTSFTSPITLTLFCFLDLIPKDFDYTLELHNL